MANDCLVEGIVRSKNKKDIEDVKEYLNNGWNYNIKTDFILNLGIFNMKEIPTEDNNMFWYVVRRYEDLYAIIDYYEKLLSQKTWKKFLRYCREFKYKLLGKRDVNSIKDAVWMNKYIKPNYIVQDIEILREAMNKLQNITKEDFENCSACINILMEDGSMDITYDENTKEYEWIFLGVCKWSIEHDLYITRNRLIKTLPKGICSLLTFEDVTKERPDLKVILEGEEYGCEFSEFYAYYQGKRLIDKVENLSETILDNEDEVLEYIPDCKNPEEYINMTIYNEVPAWYIPIKHVNYDFVTDIELNDEYMIDSLNKEIEKNKNQE